MTTEVPWNSMELLVSSKLAQSKFHGFPWNSMELFVSSKLAHSKFHEVPLNSMELLCQRNWRTSSSMEFRGIPWNCSCQRNWHSPSSMDFHGTARVSKIGALWVPRNSMEFCGTVCVIEIGTLQVPWNGMESFFCYLMEPLLSSLLWVLNLDRIPWNLSFVSVFHQHMFYYQYLHYTTCISGITHYVSKYHSKSLFNSHWNLFWSKLSMAWNSMHF